MRTKPQAYHEILYENKATRMHSNIQQQETKGELWASW